MEFETETDNSGREVQYTRVDARHIAVVRVDDSGPINPMEDGDYLPPMQVLNLDRGEWAEVAGSALADAPEFTEDELRADGKAIAAACGCKSLLRLADHGIPYAGYVFVAAEEIDQGIYDVLFDMSLTDRMDAIAELYKVKGITTLRAARSGYVQGDCLEFLAWIDKPQDWGPDHGLYLENAVNTVASWAFGDVFFAEVFEVDHTVDTGEWLRHTDCGMDMIEVPERCHGFYGTDHAASGLCDWVEEASKE